MANGQINKLLEFVNMQMAAEAFLSRVVDEVPDQPPEEQIANRLVAGNTHASIFTPVQAQQFTTQFEVLAQYRNDPLSADGTGFSATLFKNRKTEELTLSFRSTEFVDDEVRDGKATNDLEIKDLGWAFGQIAEMEAWYKNALTGLSGPLVDKTFNVTGYSLGGHLATAFNILRREESEATGAPNPITATYTFNGAGTGRILNGRRLTDLLSDFNQIRENYAASPQWIALSEAERISIRNQAQSRVNAINADRAYVAGLQGVANPAFENKTAPTGIQSSLDYQIAALIVGRDTVGAFASNVPFPASSLLLAPIEQRFSRMAEIVGLETGGDATSFVSNSGIHYGTRVEIPIEAQPSYRGNLPSSALTNSILNGSVKLLVDNPAINDFGDTHGLVLVVDSLSLMASMEMLDPSITQETAGRIYAAVSNANASSKTGTQGKAEGDTLERALDAIRKLLLGPGGQPTPYSLEGNTWSLATFRRPFQDNLAILMQAIEDRGLTGRVTIDDLTTISPSDLVNIAQGSEVLGYRYALKELNPFAVVGDNSIYFQHNVNDELDLYDSAVSPHGLTIEYLNDRAAFLRWKILKNTANLQGAVTQPVATPSDYVDLASAYNVQVRSSAAGGPTTVDAAKFIFGGDKDESINGGLRDDHLYGDNGKDALSGKDGDDYLEGGQGNDLLSGGAGKDTLAGGTGNDVLRGGVGNDAYRIGRNDGTEHIIDYGSGILGGLIRSQEEGDGLGSIEYEGRVLGTGSFSLVDPHDPKVLTDGAMKYRFTGKEGSRGTLTITDTGSTGIAIIVQNFKSGELGITLPALSPVQKSELDGTEGADTLASTSELQKIFGFGGNDRIHVNLAQAEGWGGLGDDFITNDAGDQYLYGEEGNDILIASEGNDELYGGFDNDALQGGADDDYLTGDEGNDFLAGGMGEDVLAGGDGNDFLFGGGSYEAQGFGGQIIGELDAQGQGWVVSHIANVSGNANTYFFSGFLGADQLIGDGGDVLDGGAGCDFLQGGFGDDLLIGGDGDDTLNGQGDADTLFGDEGSDVLYGDTATYDASSGFFTAPDSHGDDYLDGGVGNDSLYGQGGDDMLYGGEGEDVLVGDDLQDTSLRGNDCLDGGAGDDFIGGDGGDDTIYGGEGADRIHGDDNVLAAQFHGNDYIDGGNGDDIVSGDGGADTLFGDDGEDLIEGDSDFVDIAYHGDDYIDGGAGNDVLRGNGGNDTLIGDPGNDALAGGDGDDAYAFDTGDGQDSIEESAGTDTIRFGDGIAASSIVAFATEDTPDCLFVKYSAADTIAIAKGIAGAIEVVEYADGSSESWADFLAHAYYAPRELMGTAGPDLIIGGGGVDSVTGGGGNDVIEGGEGRDHLRGDSGDDQLAGGTGNDILEGGTGVDTLFGRDGDDTYVLNAGDGHDSIDDDAGYNAIQFGAGIDVAGISAHIGVDSDGAQYLIVDYDVSDEVAIKNNAAGGIAVLYFSDGEVLDLDAIEKLTFVNSHRIVGTAAANTIVGTIGVDVIIGRGGDDSMGGGDSDDYIAGGAGNDTLRGNSGNDIIAGGAGDDLLMGGLGLDTYVFRPGDGHDTVSKELVSAGPGLGNIFDPVADIVRFEFWPGQISVLNYFNSYLQFTANTGDTLKIESGLSVVNGSVPVNQIVFRDGTVWDLNTIRAQTLIGTGAQDTLSGFETDDLIEGFGGADYLYGLNGNDTLDGGTGNDQLNGASGNDRLEGGVGDDYLSGGIGSDTYLYRMGDGSDTISEFTESSTIDILRFVGDSGAIGSGDVKIETSGNNLVIALNDGSGRITLSNWFSSRQSASGLAVIDRIEFTDGVSLVAADIDARNLQDQLIDGSAGNLILTGDDTDHIFLAGAGDALNGGSGDDTFIFSKGTGHVTLTDAGGTNAIRFGPGVAPYDVSFVTTVAGGSAVSHITFGAGDEIAVPHDITLDIGKVIQNFRFEGNISMSLEDVAAIAGGQTLIATASGVVYGGTGADNIYGSSGNDYLNSGLGNDFIAGGAGDDVIDPQNLSGNVSIEAQLSARFGAESNILYFTRGDGNDQLIYSDPARRLLSGTDTIVFGPGISPTDVSLELVSAIPELYSGFHVFEGFPYYQFAPTTAILPDNEAWFNRHKAAGGGWQFSQDATRFTFRIKYGNNDSVQFSYDSIDESEEFAGQKFPIKQILFADGLNLQLNSTLIPESYSGVLYSIYSFSFVPQVQFTYGTDGPDEMGGSALPDRIAGAGGDDVIRGWAGIDTLLGGDGDDQLFGGFGDDYLDGGAGDDYLEERGGNDTFFFGRGSGHDLIFDYDFDYGSIAIDTIQLAPDVLERDISLTLNEYDSLVITIPDSGDSLEASLWGRDPLSAIDSIEFGDGTTWDGAAIVAHVANPILGGDDDETLSGTDGRDFISAASGNDLLYGGAGDDRLAGGAGDDTYVFNVGDGVDHVQDNQGNNIISFGGGITRDMLALGLGSLLINISTGDAIHIDDFDPTNVYASPSVVAFDFADGSSLTYSKLLESGFDIVGTGGDDDIAGTNVTDRIQSLEGNDTLDGGAGNDLLVGGPGNDTYVFGVGYGQDVIDASGALASDNDRVLLLVLPDEIAVARTGVDLVIALVGSGDTLTISDFDSPGNHIAGVIFNDGTTWSRSALAAGANPANRAPVIAISTPDLLVTEDSPVNFALAAGSFADPDSGDVLIYTASRADGTALPQWLGFDAYTSAFSGMPGNGDVGAYSIRVTATDAGGLSASDTFGLTVVNVNDAPTLVAAISDQSALEDSPFTFTVALNTFADVDAGDSLGYAATRGDGSLLPAWLAFDAASRTFMGTPQNSDVGSVSIKVIATDLTGLSVSDVFNVTVANTNDAPVLANPLADRMAIIGMPLSFQFAANAFFDVDVGDTIAYSAQLNSGLSLPSWLAFDAASRTFSGAPAIGSTGVLSIRVYATDIGHASTYDVFDLTVNPPAGLNLIGTPGLDVLNGGNGNDTLNGLGSADRLNGQEGDDKLVYYVDGIWTSGFAAYNAGSPGTPGSGKLVSLAGFNRSFDVFNGGTGTDVLTGTPGNDVLALDDNLSPFPGATRVPRIDGIERFEGGDGSDVIDLTSFDYAYGSVTLDGGNGNDALWASSGNDVLLGGAGNDDVYGGVGQDYLAGGSGKDTLNGDRGNDVLQADDGDDVLADAYGNNLLYASDGNDTLTGGAGHRLYIGGRGNDTITLGAGADIIAFNRGDGRDMVVAGTAQNNAMSLGGGVRYSDLFLSRQADNLVVETGADESITLKNWFSAAKNHSVFDLQVIAAAMNDFDASGGDPLRDNKVEHFDFGRIVQAFDQAQAASPVNANHWSMMNALLDAHLAGSDTDALGGDLAYQYGLAGSLTGMGLTPVQGILADSGFGVSAQQLRPLQQLQEGLVRIG